MTQSPFSCERCNSALFVGSHFCQNCGLAFDKPVPETTNASKSIQNVTTDVQPTKDTYGIACPNYACQTKNYVLYNKANSRNEIVCSHCQTKFSVSIYRVRTGTSRKSATETSYSIRVKDWNGVESLIEFNSYRKERVEFKSGDIIGFVYVQAQMKLVQNFTINDFKYVDVPPTRGGCCGCGGATIVLLVLILAHLFHFDTSMPSAFLSQQSHKGFASAGLTYFPK